MTKSEMRLYDLAFLGPLLLCLNQCVSNTVDEYVMLWIAIVSADPASLALRHAQSLWSVRCSQLYKVTCFFFFLNTELLKKKTL